MTYRTRHRWTILLTTCVLVHAARTDNYRPGPRLPNTNFLYDLQNYDTSRNSLVSAQQQQQQKQSTNSNENSSGIHDEVKGTGVYIQEGNRENIANRALGKDRFLGNNGRQYEPSRRKVRSSYESRAFGFHRGREGVRNGDRIVSTRNGCSGMRYEAGEGKTNRQGVEGMNCDDRVSPTDSAVFKSHTRSSTFSNSLPEAYGTSGIQVENYPVGGNFEDTAPNDIKFRTISSATISNSGSQRTGGNGNYTTDLVSYGYAGSRKTDEKSDYFASLRHEGRSSGTGETSRNGRQTAAGSDETREGEVMQSVEPNAVAEPRQGRDSVSSYTDFLINEGSYKFWAVFQVVTALLLIYSAFAAIYYAKYTFSMMDYPDYLDEGFFFKRSGEAYVTTTTARPSSYSFLGLSSQTFQRIMNALSSKKYS